MSPQSVVSQAGLSDGEVLRNLARLLAAVLTRWAVALGGYILAAGLPTPALRLSSFFIGLAFPCWPNLAYHSAELHWSNGASRLLTGLQASPST